MQVDCADICPFALTHDQTYMFLIIVTASTAEQIFWMND